MIVTFSDTLSWIKVLFKYNDRVAVSTALVSTGFIMKHPDNPTWPSLSQLGLMANSGMLQMISACYSALRYCPFYDVSVTLVKGHCCQ